MIDFEGGKGSEYFTPDVIRSGITLASGKPMDKPASVQPAVYQKPSTGIDVAMLPGPGTSRYNVKRGMQGQSVQDLQARLIGLGYNLGKAGADGDFGPATRRAVKQFQKDYGLSIDGIAGDQTFTALNKISPISSA
jgi:peptidoglycan hydrolase-like protein with peptidoglycan-binding domain